MDTLLQAGDEYREQPKVKELPHMVVLGDKERLGDIVEATIRQPWTELLSLCTRLGLTVAREVAAIRRRELGPTQIERTQPDTDQEVEEEDDDSGEGEREVCPVVVASSPQPTVAGEHRV